MAEAINKFIPIDQIQSDRVRVNLELPPFVPPSSIGINVGRITWLCNVAGINHIRVESVNQVHRILYLLLWEWTNKEEQSQER
jgi:hypothetical protein